MEGTRTGEHGIGTQPYSERVLLQQHTDPLGGSAQGTIFSRSAGTDAD